jgi:hypothetical protein
MEAIKRINRPYPVITQTESNTTLWIGHLQSDPTDHFAGQTFTCPASGDLNNIQVYSAVVHSAGQVMLSLHAFDEETKSWGPVLASSIAAIEKTDEHTWIRFEMPPMPLHKNATYGFRLFADRAMIALGESATTGQKPFKGQEWHADSNNQTGEFYNYFSLAFKVEMCA